VTDPAGRRHGVEEDVVLRKSVHIPILLYRWLALAIGTIGYLVGLIGVGEVDWLTLGVLGIAIFFALVFTILGLLRRPHRWPWPVPLVLDIVVSGVLLVLTGGAESPFLLFYLTPVLETALWASLQVSVGVTVGLGVLYPFLVALNAWGDWVAALFSARFLVSEGIFFLLALLVIMLLGPVLRWREREGQLAQYERLFSLSGTERPGVMAVITEEVMRALESDVALIFLRELAGDRLEVQIPDPYPMATLSRSTLRRIEWDQECLSRLTMTDSPALLVNNDFSRFPIPESMRNIFLRQPFLAAALVLEGDVIGLMLAGRRGGQTAFHEGDLSRVAELAARTAQVVGWTESLCDLRQRYAEMRALNQVVREINSPRRLEEVLQRIVENAREVLQVDRASVMLLDDSGQWLKVRAIDGIPFAKPISQGVPVGQGISGWVVQHNQPLIIAPGDIGRFRSEEEREVNQALCIPLRLDGHVIGVLNLSLLSSAGRVFTHEDVSLAQILADVAAVAIGKADLMEKVLKHTRALSQANRALAVERNKLKQTIRGIADGVVVIDPADCLILLNDAAVRLLDLGDEDAVGMDIAAYLREQGLDELAGLLQRLRQEGRSLTGPLVYRGPLQKEGQHVYEVQVNSIYAAGAKREPVYQGAVAVVRDVTVEVEEEESRSQFVSSMAQEIRTPMASIKGYLELLCSSEPGPLTQKQEEFLTRASYNVDRCVNTLDNFLDLSRIQEGGLSIYFEPMDVAELVQDVTNLVQSHAASRQLDLRVTPPPQMEAIVASYSGLRQVLLNLLDNAIRNTSIQGKVFLRVEDEGRRLKFAVQDTGVGIPEEMRDRVFQRGTHAESGRVAMGLYIAKQIVEGHRGTIWLESEVGKGTAVFFTLPKDPTRGDDSTG